ncbi:hypothetical protein BHM03_00028538 [Ensete ventricosum]|nr:hypothetical protein BHM03_00028538 [Ensete ventricosum]
MSCEVLHRPFSGDIGLQEEAEHGQPPVLDLLHLQQSGLVGIIRQIQGIEWPPQGGACPQNPTRRTRDVCLQSQKQQSKIESYQPVDDSIVLCTSDEHDLSDDCNDISPNLVKASGMMKPAAASIAHLAWTSS